MPYNLQLSLCISIFQMEGAYLGFLWISPEVYVCRYPMYIFIHQTWTYKNYTVIMKLIIYSVKIFSPIGRPTISNSEIVDSAIIVKLGKYTIICRHDSTYGCRL